MPVSSDRPRRLGVRVALIALAAALLVSACGRGANVTQGTPGGAASPRPFADTAAANIKAVPMRSKYETKARVVSRDGGVSVALPDGHDLWIFGDTGVFRRSGTNAWTSTAFIDGSTSLLTNTTKGSVPSGGEVPSGVPKRFIPVPQGVYLPDGSGRPCTYYTAAFPARWPTGAAMLTKSEVLVTYSIVCVTIPSGQPATRAEGWGYMLYNWKTHHIDQGPRDVFKPRANGATFPRSKIFGSPWVNNGSVTFFSSQCAAVKWIGCTGGHVWAATMPATTRALSQPASYKLTPLSTDGSGKWRPLSISVGHYTTGLRLVEMNTIAGTYNIFSAPTAGARWHLTRSGTLPGCPTRKGFCIALEGHPELSTATYTFVSYKDADARPGGHVVVSALPN